MPAARSTVFYGHPIIQKIQVWCTLGIRRRHFGGTIFTRLSLWRCVWEGDTATTHFITTTLPTLCFDIMSKVEETSVHSRSHRAILFYSQRASRRYLRHMFSAYTCCAVQVALLTCFVACRS